MERALYDFADAVTGKDSAMHWSLNGSILRRQIAPVFQRCSEGTLTAEQALDIVVDFTAARTENTVDILTRHFQHLESKIDTILSSRPSPSLLAVQEVFMGLNPDAEWATDPDILRKEMYKIFVRVAVGNMTTTDGMTTFCDQIQLRSKFYLEIVRDLTERLTLDIVEASKPEEPA